VPGGRGVIEYPIGVSGQVLVFTGEVVGHFRRHRQLRWKQAEVGGQLFARFEGSRILVVEATGPRDGDRGTRASYVPDRRAEQAEIAARHSLGLHYVGDWHTHPEAVPTPSRLDAASISECFAKSTHDLNGFVFVSVGKAKSIEGLHVSINDGIIAYQLKPGSSEE
jgi:integrative and conjugative element protein (TIGR02256 family)